MNKLCFGTFARALQGALQKPNSNQAVAELLLGLVAMKDSSEPFTMLPKKVSSLFNFKEDVQEEIVSLASTSKAAITITESFSIKVIPYLKPTQIEDLKENMRKLIVGDESIAPKKQDELLMLADIDDLSEFLSAVYLYALNRSNKLHYANEISYISKTPDDHPMLSIQSIQDTIENIKREQQKTIDDLNKLQQIIAQYEDFTSIPVKRDRDPDKRGSHSVLKIEPSILLNYINPHFNDRVTDEAVKRYFALIRQIIEVFMQSDSNLASAFSDGVAQRKAVVSRGDENSRSIQINSSDILNHQVCAEAESLYSARARLNGVLDELYVEERSNQKMIEAITQDLSVDFL